MAVFASASDVAARWRPLTSDEETVAETLISDASAMVRARFPGIEDQFLSGQVDADALIAVVAGMVKRAMIAPADGMSQQTESAGPYSQSRSFSNPLGNLFLTQADVALILGYQPSGQSIGFANDTTACRGSYGAVYGW